MAEGRQLVQLDRPASRGRNPRESAPTWLPSSSSDVVAQERVEISEIGARTRAKACSEEPAIALSTVVVCCW